MRGGTTRLIEGGRGVSEWSDRMHHVDQTTLWLALLTHIGNGCLQTFSELSLHYLLTKRALLLRLRRLVLINVRTQQLKQILTLISHTL